MEFIGDFLMNEIKVSVIVPIYNTEKFLRKCIESIINQTLQEIEIILINDGSTDNSHNICLEYAEKYPEKVRYINNKNIGCSATRNLGIELAKGEFIAFVDSDDYIEKEMYEKMYTKSQKTESDIVICGINTIFLKNRKIWVRKVKNKNEKYKYLTREQLLNNPVNKIFKTNLLRKNKILFPLNTQFAEDIVFCIKSIIYCQKMSAVEKEFYNYIIHENNSVHNLEIRRGVFKSFKWLFSFLAENNCLKDKKIYNCFYNFFNFYAIRSVFFMILNPNQVSEKEYKKYDKIFYEELQKIDFLTIKSKFLIFYYRNLVFFIRKFHLYFFLKRLKAMLRGEFL